jgi:tetratricopeptide (TPR) repeat protein
MAPAGRSDAGASRSPSTPATAESPEELEARLKRADKAKKKCHGEYYALRFESARDACRELVRENPDDIEGRTSIGWASLELGDTDEALATAEEALKIAVAEGDQATANVLKAAALLVLGQQARSRDALEAAQAQGYKGIEAGARLACLRSPGGPLPENWVKHTLPRYACWLRKGSVPAQRYLLRRGILDTNAYERAVETLAPDVRVKRVQDGLVKCPW